MAQLKRFRQLGSTTPGHPEAGHTVVVETTTGPLGQGLATAVGMALAERMDHARYGDLSDHYTYVLAGDGCLMEGVSQEAISLAGHLGLGRLIVLWDDNQITIDGPVADSSSEDQVGRFEAAGWHVISVSDGTDIEAIDAAIVAAKRDTRPSLIAMRTVIGHGAPDVGGTSKAHGAPLGAEQLRQAKALASWSYPDFTVPDEVRDMVVRLRERGSHARAQWCERFAALDGDVASGWRRTHRRELPDTFDSVMADIKAGLAGKTMATRQASHQVLTALAEQLPELVGGSADLAGSTGTGTGQATVSAASYEGSQIAFGIREFAMMAVLNGISLHGGFRSYGSMFLVFSDYLRPALRLAALMREPVIVILTHDSVAVGEDGPTHQPIEHSESLRLIPGVTVLRPADATETAEAWERALRTTDGPTALLLSRQGLPPITEPAPALPNHGRPVELVATGSEVALALGAAEQLRQRGVAATVRSVPCRDDLEHASGPRVAIEAGVTSGWRGYADLVIGLDTFGASGPGDAVLAHFGFSADAVAFRIATWLDERDVPTKENSNA